ncbi:MAG: lipopolysaccharide biosynthesis protein [Microcystis aeruginosa Ma_AC_P_19900807_S300]|nr:MAG: lipopolysaccharide biosynthesis protein [Microcystis aeruginosa Ma_AC_P_19900807_S300]
METLPIVVKDELSFRDILEICKDWIGYFKSKWIIIVVCVMIGVSIGILKAVQSEYSYKANLSFVLEEEGGSGGLGGALGLASQLGVDIGGGGAKGVFNSFNLLELMKSRNVVEKALLTMVIRNNRKTTLADAFLDIYKWKSVSGDNSSMKKLTSFLETNPEQFTIIHDSIISSIHKKLLKGIVTITPRDKKGGIIDVNVISPDELFSKQFAEALVNVVSSFYIETKTKKTMSNVLILQKQVDSVRFELNRALGGVAETLDATYNLNPAMSKTRMPSQKRQIDVTANTAILTELVKNLELAKITLRRETPLMQIVDSPILPLDKIKLGKTKGALIGLFSGLFLSIFYLTGFRLYKKFK